MRNSHIAMLAALGAVILVIVVVIGAVRIALFDSNGDFDPESAGTNTATVSRELTGFNAINIRSGWSVELERDESWTVSLSVPEDEDENLDVFVDRNTLVLDTRDTRDWNWFGGNDTYEARITLPNLNAIEIDGAGHVEIDGFDEDSLSVVINGMAAVEGRDSSFRKVSIAISGFANVDLTRVPTENVDVMLTGASNVDLNMDGGQLTGTSSGFSNVNYRGTVSNENIRVSGFTNVSPE